MLYADFTAFTRDQEQLIFSQKAFDYIEGFVIINRTGLLNNWRLSFNPQDPVEASKFKSDGRTLFCLELAKYFNQEESFAVNQVQEQRFNLYIKLSGSMFGKHFTIDSKVKIQTRNFCTCF